MRATLKYALIFSGGAILTKLILWKMELLENNATSTSMVYLFAMLVSIFIALNETKNKEQATSTGYFQDLRVAMQSVAYFTIIISFFTYIFYQYIDWEYMYDRLAERITAAENFELTEENNPGNKTKEEFIEDERKIAEIIFSAFTHSTITLIGFMIVGTVYSLILTFVVRMNPKYNKS